MARKTYKSPIFFNGELPVGGDPTIVLPPSQTTSGYDTPYTFEGIDEDTLDMIELWCDDYQLDDMDTNDDYKITLAEFQAWYNSQSEKPF